MIKLKLLLSPLLTEARKLDLNKVEDAAEYLIRQTWRTMPSTEDKFSDYQLFLYLDNEPKLSELLWKLAKKFFPEGTEDDAVDKFTNIIRKQLEAFENKKQQRLAAKINPLDPLFILKSIVIRKTWEGAKQSLVKNSIGSWAYTGGRISDAEAENIFNRMYKNAMGETVYDEPGISTLGRLSSLTRQPITGKNEDDIHNYTINLFLDQYAGYKSQKFPDKVRVYRGVNNPLAPIRPGDYVSFDKDYAKSYMRGKFGSIVSDYLDSKDLYVDKMEPNRSEMVYWPEGHKIKKYEGHIPTFKEFWKEINSY